MLRKYFTNYSVCVVFCILQPNSVFYRVVKFCSVFWRQNLYVNERCSVFPLGRVGISDCTCSMAVCPCGKESRGIGIYRGHILIPDRHNQTCPPHVLWFPLYLSGLLDVYVFAFLNRCHLFICNILCLQFSFMWTFFVETIDFCFRQCVVEVTWSCTYMCNNFSEKKNLWYLTCVYALFINSLAPGEFDCSLKLVNFKLISMINIVSIFCKIAIKWMPQHLTGH